MAGYNKPKFDFFVEKRPFRNSFELAFLQKLPSGRVAVAQPLVLTEIEEGLIIEPFVTIDYEVAQSLIDDLWRCGLRPSECHGSAGQLGATERHLNDIKKILFHHLNIDK